MATYRFFPACLLGASLLIAGNAIADVGGLYVGGGVGETRVDIDADDVSFDFDEDDLSWKIYGGYRTDILPLFDLAGELTYRDFGSPDTQFVKYDASGVDASGLGIFPIGPIDLFAKVGVIWFDQELRVAGFNTSDDSGTAGLWGFGASFRLGSLGVRGEWERMEEDEVDGSDVDKLEMWSVSAFWIF